MKVKNIILVALLLMVSLGLQSCKWNDGIETPVIELVAPTSSFEVDETAQDVEVQIYANKPYSISFINKEAGAWATLGQTRGDGDMILKISLRENGDFRRMAKVLLQLDSQNRTDTLTIKQKGIEPYLTCASPFVTAKGSEAGTVSFDIDTNIPFEQIAISYSEGADKWIHNIDYVEGKVVMDVDQNGATPRNSTVKLAFTELWDTPTEVTLLVKQSDSSDNFGTETSFASIRELATAEGAKIAEPLVIKGWVISDWKSKNMELNPSLSSSKVDVSVSDKTAYIESEDGTMGFRLQFNEVIDNTLTRYTLVSINLEGATVTKEENPTRYTISGLTNLNLLEGSAPNKEALPKKEKAINELTDDDIYTFVTLKNTEFLIKYGSYCNIRDNYGQASAVNEMLGTGRNNRMDGWAELLHDNNGNGIYMLMNTLVEWRRKGNGVPQGAGDMSGIIVHTNMPRYGGYIGRYSIRPVDEDDVLSMGNGASSYTKVAEYNGERFRYRFGLYNRVYGSRYADAKLKSILPPDYITNWTAIKMEMVCENHIAPITANSYPIQAGNEYSALTAVGNGNRILSAAEDPGEKAAEAGVEFYTQVKGWYQWDEEGNVIGYNGFRWDFNASSLEGEQMIFGFTFHAGSVSYKNSRTFPAHWIVEYKIGDGEYKPLRDIVIQSEGQEFFYLRSLPWWDQLLNGNNYTTAAEAGLGSTTHCFVIPNEVFGQEKVSLHLRPYDKVLTVLPLIWNAPSDTATITSQIAYDNLITIGSATLRYK